MLCWTVILILMSLASQSALRPNSNKNLVAAASDTKKRQISLPAPETAKGMALAEALSKRRSVRSYIDRPLSISEISQLLWSAQGETRSGGYRTAPSAGAKYPLELYVVTASGHYHYTPRRHRLTILGNADLRRQLQDASLGQEAIGDAPTVVVFAAVYERTEEKYGERAKRYVQLEAGHACQNLLLQTAALGLGGVPIGAFNDARVKNLLALPDDQDPLYVVPIGRPIES